MEYLQIGFRGNDAFERCLAWRDAPKLTPASTRVPHGVVILKRLVNLSLGCTCGLLAPFAYAPYPQLVHGLGGCKVYGGGECGQTSTHLITNHGFLVGP